MDFTTKEFKAGFDEFSGVFDRFKKKNGGWSPGNIHRWYVDVERNHEGLRKLLGGVKKQAFYKIKSEQNPVPLKEAEPIIDRVLKIIPDYLEYYNYTKSVFLLPTIQQGSHSAFKTTKNIKTHAEQALRNKTEFEYDAGMKSINQCLVDLGKLWSKGQSSEFEIETTISTSPRGFYLLGHYGPDGESCFGQHSDKTRDKFILGQTRDTFVFTASQLDKHNKYDNVCRAFGWFSTVSDQYDICNIANYYAVPGFLEGDGFAAIKKTLSDIWKIDTTQIGFQEEISAISRTYNERGDVYHNPYARWSFTKGLDKIPLRKSTLDCNSYLVRYFNCILCNGNARGDDLSFDWVDDNWYCPNCVAKARICELTARKTLKELIEIVGKGGKYINVHPDALKDLPKCGFCHQHHLEPIKIENEELCAECVDLNFTQCECCGKTVKDSDMFEGGTLDVCKQCVNSGELPIEEYDLLLAD